MFMSFYMFAKRLYLCDVFMSFESDIVALAHPCFKTCLRFQDIVALAHSCFKTCLRFQIIGTMTKLRQVSEPIFAARNFMHRRQVDIIPKMIMKNVTS